MYATMVTSVPGGAIAVLAVALGRNLHVSPENGALLAAAFGFGGLVGSLAVIARPLLGEPEKLVTATMALVGAGFAFCALAPSYALAVVAFALVGALNSPMFAATLASRATYSPPQARAQIFVSMAALKVAASSLGTAAVGVAIGIGARPLLGIGAAAILVTAAATIIERRATEPRNGAPTDGSAEAAGVTGGQATAVPRAPGTPRG
jgi:predicted MFS family arabinose efflux permease